MKAKSLQQRENTATPKWQVYKDLVINKSLFKKGIVFAKHQSLDDNTSQFFTKDSFLLGERELNIITAHETTEKNVNHSVALAENLMKKICDENKTKVYIINRKRREEIFLPHTIFEHEQLASFYIYPWINKAEFKFNGFQNFATCGCLFGANLKVIDSNNQTFTLIRHKNYESLSFIKNIEYDESAANPYEEVLFYELEKIAHLINKFSKSKQKELIYHLPHYDYILFGIQLFIYGKLNYEQLDKFINLIMSKAKLHRYQINKIFERNNINVLLQSPFENIFFPTEQSHQITDEIFKILQLSTHDGTFRYLSMDGKIDAEQNIIEFCLNKLQSNSHNKIHRDTWIDFLKISPSIKNFENLFKLANALMIAVSAKGKENFSTCSMLPLSEKQIQVQYNSMYNHFKNNEKNNYPAIFNMTFLDPVISFSPNNKGQLFYFDSGQETLAELITHKKILEYSQQNLFFFSQQKSHDNNLSQPISLGKVLGTK